MKRKVLGPEFFDRPTLTVARDLIGKYLVRKIGKKKIALMITETEGYFGFKDQASKARRGKTPGNLPMYAKPGTIYVYFTYGMHWMLNIVTEKEEYPAAVLIRGVVLQGNPLRKSPRVSRIATPSSGSSIGPDYFLSEFPAPLNGPAKLTKFLKIDKSLNTKTLGLQSGLWVEDRGVKVRLSQIKKTPRVGIAYAGEWATKPWRFILKTEATRTRA